MTRDEEDDAETVITTRAGDVVEGHAVRGVNLSVWFLRAWTGERRARGRNRNSLLLPSIVRQLEGKRARACRMKKQSHFRNYAQRVGRGHFRTTLPQVATSARACSRSSQLHEARPTERVDSVFFSRDINADLANVSAYERENIKKGNDANQNHH
jgi:hypothetical protein